MTNLRVCLPLAVLMATAAASTVQAQSRAAALGVQVEVLPTCAISLPAGGSTLLARVSCAGRAQPTVRASVANDPAALVRLTPTGRGRAAGDVALPGASDTRLLTIQF